MSIINSACGIRCEVGYILNGTSIRLCQPNATWSGIDPVCEGRLGVLSVKNTTCIFPNVMIIEMEH